MFFDQPLPIPPLTITHIITHIGQCYDNLCFTNVKREMQLSFGSQKCTFIWGWGRLSFSHAGKAGLSTGAQGSPRLLRQRCHGATHCSLCVLWLVGQPLSGFSFPTYNWEWRQLHSLPHTALQSTAFLY